jgi:4a-hydroxytetrahydrobiopterin dehydratase
MSEKEKTRVYTEEEVRERLERELPDWYLENGWIRRYYKTDGWQATMMLVNTIGYLAEAAYHHPDLTVSWAKVWVKLQNHQAGGITDKDFQLAKKIEETVLWRPEADSPLGPGTPNKWVRSGEKPK